MASILDKVNEQKPKATVHEQEHVAPAFKIKRRVTFHHIIMQADVEYVLRFDSAIFQGERNVSRDAPASDAPSEDDNPPPYLANVTLMDTGEIGQIIIPSLLRRELEKLYAGDDLIGAYFAITPGGKKRRKSGKGEYNTFQIIELEAMEPAM
jgi:hypothetical protein